MENIIIDRIAIEDALEALPPEHCAMIKLMYGWDCPADWTGSWPPKITEIGTYIGNKYEGKPLSEAAMRYRHKVIKRYWKKERGMLRRAKPQK